MRVLVVQRIAVAVYLELDFLAGVEEGNLFAEVALRLTAGVGLGRDDHHAELNLAAGVRCQQFVHDGRLLLVAQHHTGALGDDDRGIVFVFEKVIDGRFQRRADGAESGNGRVDRTVFDLAYHGAVRFVMRQACAR